LERVYAQEIVVNLTLFVSPRQGSQTDHVSDCVNYATVCDRVRHRVQTTEYQLVETLADDIAKMILSEFEVHECRVRIEKPHALPGTDSVGVQIHRKNRSATPELSK
jgi:7,8-dihydroneopterin aldolase/epimerase/oxygenase